MRVFRAILFLSWFVIIDRAESSNPCSVCRLPLAANHFVVSHPVSGEQLLVCESCRRLETVCFACGLPVKLGYLKLEDGRLLCEQDAKSAVLSPGSAARIFEDVKRDLIGMLSGLGFPPKNNITVILVHQPQLENLRTMENSNHDQQLALGFTRSRKAPDREFEHTIYLLSGLQPSRLQAVCAHEYAHAWVNENVPAERRIEKETEEGFCELVAYKLMTLRNDEAETRVIRANTYTKGRIDMFIKAESEYQFFRVVEWMKRGVDDTVPRTNLARLLVLQERAAPSLAWQPPTATPVPDTLVLKGISGTPTRRFALINDRTVERNERARIRVGNSSLTIRCLDISDNSVLISLEGSEEKKQLFLSNN